MAYDYIGTKCEASDILNDLHLTRGTLQKATGQFQKSRSKFDQVWKRGREASKVPSRLQLRCSEGESIMGLLHPKTKKVGRYHNKENAVIWNCYTIGKKRRPYTASEIDFYAVYFRDLEKVYLVPFNHAGAKVGYVRLS